MRTTSSVGSWACSSSCRSRPWELGGFCFCACAESRGKRSRRKSEATIASWICLAIPTLCKKHISRILTSWILEKFLSDESTACGVSPNVGQAFLPTRVVLYLVFFLTDLKRDKQGQTGMSILLKT